MDPEFEDFDKRLAEARRLKDLSTPTDLGPNIDPNDIPDVDSDEEADR